MRFVEDENKKKPNLPQDRDGKLRVSKDSRAALKR